MPRPSAAALLYAPDGFDESQPQVMGRQAAGAGFLRGLVRHADFDRLVALTTRPGHAVAFGRQVAVLGARVRVETLEEAEYRRLSEAGCLMLPGPDLGGHGWRRRPSSPWSASPTPSPRRRRWTPSRDCRAAALGGVAPTRRRGRRCQ
ncbi:hypothetical protein [Falsiroseomonas sp. E2-1-a20]|uniref:hypothetical protein n=1 Tax=Falsiroseomonas sp. E2-1-a20 TaxID=3239300 RepID=UPI003F2EE8C9